MTRDVATLEDFSQGDAAAFVRTAYKIILGREPTESEDANMRAALMRGDARTWLLGRLRYGEEGRARDVFIRGLRPRYIAQYLFRLPLVGPFVEWVNAQRRLSLALRQIRMIESEALRRSSTFDAQSHRLDELQRQALELRATVDNAGRVYAGEREAFHAALHDQTREREALRSALEREASERRSDRMRVVDIEHQLASVQGDVVRLMTDLRAVSEALAIERQKLSAVLPPPLAPTFEIVGDSLAASARKRHGVGETVRIPELPADERYALFESVFYDTNAVAAKQRIYIPYLDRELTSRWPFLDLGCGRGEFLQILRDEAVDAIGVDINASNIARLLSRGFNVVGDDLVAFLERDRGSYSGAAVLQVVEHLPFDRVERMLDLLYARLVPGALLILETPNPLSTFALSVFHSDPTHLKPLPPEALRYSVEAAGFDRTRTLYQARIPLDQFAGPDPRAYYADYAIIATRSS